MTFRTSYAKLLADPEYGQIKKREKHAKLMYIEGMKHGAEIFRCYVDDVAEEKFEEALKAIAEESK